MGMVGCYSLVLYCDHPGCRAHGDFTGRTFSGALRDARSNGWSLSAKAESPEWSMSGGGSGVARCPNHKGAHVRI